MKYSILNQIEVLDFNISSGELNYVNVNKDLIFRDKIMSKETTVAGYFFNNSFFFFWDNLDTLILDIKTKKIFNIGLVAPHYETLSNSRVICNEYKDSISFEKKLIELNLQDFSKKDILDPFEYGLKLRIGDDIICTGSHTTLKSINLETGTYHWEADLNEYCRYSSVATSYQIVEGMIREIFGVFEDKLWVYTDARSLLGLSLQTGEVLLKIDTNKFHSGGFVFFADHFLPQEGIIGFLIEQHYLEYDLRTLTVLKEKNFDTGQHLTDWKFSLSTFTNDYVYFVGNKGSEYGFSQFVGVLNRKNLEVEWWQNMGEGNKTPYFSLTKAPLSDGKKLYVHDSEGTLHIFEKTEEN